MVVYAYCCLYVYLTTPRSSMRLKFLQIHTYDTYIQQPAHSHVSITIYQNFAQGVNDRNNLDYYQYYYQPNNLNPRLPKNIPPGKRACTSLPLFASLNPSLPSSICSPLTFLAPVFLSSTTSLPGLATASPPLNSVGSETVAQDTSAGSLFTHFPQVSVPTSPAHACTFASSHR